LCAARHPHKIDFRAGFGFNRWSQKSCLGRGHSFCFDGLF
jgi:hypothetical protein